MGTEKLVFDFSERSEATDETLLPEGVSWQNPGEFPEFNQENRYIIDNTEIARDASDRKREVKKTCLEEIFTANNNAERTIVKEYVESEFFDSLTDKNLDITSIEAVQKQLLEIPEQARGLFCRVVNSYNKTDNWRPYFTAVLNNFTNKNFANLVNSASLAREVDLETFGHVIAHKDNYWGIDQVEQLKDLDKITNIKIKEAEDRGDVEAFENFLLLKKFNLSLDESKILLQKYAYKIENVDTAKYSEMKDFLIGLKQIVSTETSNDFASLLGKTPMMTSIKDYPDFQIEIQRMYSEGYNRDLFSADDKEFIVEDDVKIVNAGTDFKMAVRSDGAFSGLEQANNYADRWNKPSRSTLSFSTSLIANNHLFYYGLYQNAVGVGDDDRGTITYGFANIDEDAIVENALGDDATIHRRMLTLDTSSYDDFRATHPTTFDGCGQRFMVFDDMIDDSSCNTHTETVMSRFYHDKDGVERRRQPSYVVYVKTDEKYQSDPIYKKSKKAAKDFNIPVVMIDMEKVLASENQKVAEMVRELDEEWEVEKVFKIVQTVANNSIKNVNYSATELVDKYFPTEKDGANILGSFVNTQIERAPTEEDRQALFNKLMVLNAKKCIIPIDTMVNIPRMHTNIRDDISRYEDEILGVTVRPQGGEGFYYYSNRKSCYKICDDLNITPSETLLVKQPRELQKIVDICRENNLNISPDLLEVPSYELEKNISICKENGVETDTRILIQKPYILSQKVRLCESNNIALNATTLIMSIEEIEAMAQELKVSDNNSTAPESDPWSNSIHENWDALRDWES